MAAVSESGRRMLPEPAAAEILGSWGIPYVEHGVATGAEEAALIAARIGYPVVLKIVSADVIHKTEVGGVLVGLGDEASMIDGYETLLRRVGSNSPQARLDGVLVARQVVSARELIVGGIRDATFGPTVMVGLGGIFAEALDDVAFRVAPLRHQDGLDMLRELRSVPVLGAFRGEGPVDLDALAGILVKVGDLLLAHSEIAEIDLNPVAVSENRCVALDARVVCAGP
jgi:acetyl-CoA synthetase (ADP-forming)